MGIRDNSTIHLVDGVSYFVLIMLDILALTSP
jgi:hypothetical protein